MADCAGDSSTTIKTRSLKKVGVKKRKVDEDRLEATFQEVVRQFKSDEEFQKFATAADGLNLEQKEVDQISEYFSGNQEEVKMHLLWEWKSQNGQKATRDRILGIVQNYHKAEDNSADEVMILENHVHVFPKKRIAEREDIFYGEQRNSAMDVRKLAVKRLKDDEVTLKEAKVLANLSRHQNVVHCLSVDWAPQDQTNFIFLAMDLCSEINLYDHTMEQKHKRTLDGRSFDHALAFRQSRQLVEGLRFLHSNSIIHGDLNPQNILLDLDNQTILKIASFGINDNIKNGDTKNTHTSTETDSDGYRAPETYVDGAPTEKSDIFSLGLLIFFLWSEGRHPYGDNATLWIKQNKRQDFQPLLIPESLLTEAMRLLERLLDSQPTNRLSTEQILKDWIFSTDESDANHCIEVEMQSEVLPELGESNDNAGDAEEECFVLFNKAKGCLQALYPAKKKLPGGGVDVELTRMPDILTCMRSQSYTAVAVKRTIYVLLWRKLVYEIQLSSKDPRWKRVESMRHGHGPYPPVTSLGDAFIVCGGGWTPETSPCVGGLEVATASNACEMFDMKTKMWKDLEPMNVKRRDNTMVTSGGCIYSIGGQDENSEFLSSVERYHPTKGSWDEIAPLNVARSAAAAAEHRGRIYVLGGLNDTDGVEMYDVESNVWAKCPQMVGCRCRFTACVLQDRLYAVGGYGSSTIEWLDESENKWRTEFCLNGIKMESGATVALEKCQTNST